MQQSRPSQVLAQARADAIGALIAQRKPDLQRPEAATQRDTPIAVVAHLAIDGSLEVTGIGRHDPHQVLRVPNEIEAAIKRDRQPLVGVHHDGVCRFNACPEVTIFWQGHGRSPHRAIDVQPQSQRLSDGSDGIDRIKRSNCRGAGGCHYGRWPQARGTVGGNGGSECGRVHPELRIDGHGANVLTPEARQQRRFFDGAVRLRRGIDDEGRITALQAGPCRTVVGGTLTGADQCHKTGCRCGVLQNAAEGRWQPQQIAQPVRHHLLNLSQCRTCLPIESDGREAARDHIR